MRSPDWTRGELLDAVPSPAICAARWRARRFTARLSPKVSVAIDGGGTLGLDGLAADVRLSADLMNDAAVFHVGVGGDAATATISVSSPPGTRVEAAAGCSMSSHSTDASARARDVLATGGVAPFQAALADLLSSLDHLAGARLAIGSTERHRPHPLRDGSFACGLGLAFGPRRGNNARTLDASGTACRRRRYSRRARPRAVGHWLDPANRAAVAAEAETLGFVVRANDPRRYVIACAGAPICAAAHIAARSLAPAVAAAAENYLDNDFRIHISGCAKGCAHAGAATLDRCRPPDGCAVIADGTVHDEPLRFARQVTCHP